MMIINVVHKKPENSKTKEMILKLMVESVSFFCLRNKIKHAVPINDSR